MNRRAWAVVAMLGLAGVAQAEGGQGWGIISAQTVGQGNSVIQGEVGWPGIPITYLYGVGSFIDVGGRFTFNYGFEGMTDFTWLGLKIQGVVRLKFIDQPGVKFGASFEPGPLFYFPTPNALVDGMALPVYFVAGFPVVSNLTLSLGLDFPMWVGFGPTTPGFFFPVQFGGGLEYFINSNLAATFNLRMGPSITPFGVYFALSKAQVGVAYRF